MCHLFSAAGAKIQICIPSNDFCQEHIPQRAQAVYSRVFPQRHLSIRLFLKHGTLPWAHPEPCGTASLCHPGCCLYLKSRWLIVTQGLQGLCFGEKQALGEAEHKQTPQQFVQSGTQGWFQVGHMQHGGEKIRFQVELLNSRNVSVVCLWEEDAVWHHVCRMTLWSTDSPSKAVCTDPSSHSQEDSTNPARGLRVSPFCIKILAQTCTNDNHLWSEVLWFFQSTENCLCCPVIFQGPKTSLLVPFPRGILLGTQPCWSGNFPTR